MKTTAIGGLKAIKSRRLVVSALVLAFTVSGGAQTSAPLGTASTVLPPGTIQGAKTPDQIPDDVAYRLFFRAVSEPSNASAQQRERLRVKLLQAHLTPADFNTTANILGQYYDASQLLEQECQRALSRSGAASASAISAQFMSTRTALVEAARASLAARLTPAGWGQFRQLVQTEKRNMTIAPAPPMSPAINQ